MKQNDMKASKDNTDWREPSMSQISIYLLFRHHVPKYKRHY